jgi:hypothetical protein
MPRLPRTVFADVPHHLTQRGNRREALLFAFENHNLSGAHRVSDLLAE